MGPLATNLIWLAVVAVVVIGLLYLFVGRRRVTAAPRELTYAQYDNPGTAADPASRAFAAAGDEPPTEDDIARARLGGMRGAPQLGEAPMAPQAREQTPHKIDDGHVA
jgi:hypothetical protein